MNEPDFHIAPPEIVLDWHSRVFARPDEFRRLTYGEWQQLPKYLREAVSSHDDDAEPQWADCLVTDGRHLAYFKHPRPVNVPAHEKAASDIGFAIGAKVAPTLLSMPESTLGIGSISLFPDPTSAPLGYLEQTPDVLAQAMRLLAEAPKPAGCSDKPFALTLAALGGMRMNAVMVALVSMQDADPGKHIAAPPQNLAAAYQFDLALSFARQFAASPFGDYALYANGGWVDTNQDSTADILAQMGPDIARLRQVPLEKLRACIERIPPVYFTPTFGVTVPDRKGRALDILHANWRKLTGGSDAPI